MNRSHLPYSYEKGHLWFMYFSEFISSLISTEIYIQLKFWLNMIGLLYFNVFWGLFVIVSKVDESFSSFMQDFTFSTPSPILIIVYTTITILSCVSDNSFDLYLPEDLWRWILGYSVNKPAPFHTLSQRKQQ